MLFNIPYLDQLGTLFSLVTTYYYIRANSIAWKIGIIATTLNTLLYLSSHLYGQAFLESLYFFSMWYGLFQWQSKSQSAERPITQLPNRHRIQLIGLSLCLIALCTGLINFFNSSPIAFWDAAILVLSLLAQWLLCKKIIETWVVWFVVDIIIFGLHYHKSIHYHAALHLIYLAFAVFGLISWYRKKMLYQAKEVDAKTNHFNLKDKLKFDF